MNMARQFRRLSENRALLFRMTVCAVSIVLCAETPLVANASEDSAETVPPRVERRKFWDADLRGIAGFHPYSYNRVDGPMGAWGIVLSGKERITHPVSGVSQVLADRSRPVVSFSLLSPSARPFLGGTLALEHTLSVRGKLEAGLNAFSGSGNSDEWRTDEPGAGIAYLITGKDRRHHYDLRGGDIFLRKGFPGGMSFQAGYFQHHVRSLSARGVWTIARSSIVRDNPPVNGGVGKGLAFNFCLDRLSRSEFFPEGWEFELSIEKTGGFLGGDFDYSLWSFGLLGAERFAGVSNYAYARLIGKTSSSDLPPHKLFSLGSEVRGIDTFERDFNLFERRGNRLLLFSSGYRRLVPTPRRLLSRFIYDLSLEGIFDAGVTFSAEKDKGALSLFGDGFSRLESSVALGWAFTVSRTRVGLYHVRSLNPDHRGKRFLLNINGRLRADGG